MTAARFDEFAPIAIGHDHRVFVLTGAGISAESGVRTFRDANGLWEQYPVETVASPGGWEQDPGLVWRFYSQRRAQVETVAPNAAHVALADLERKLGDRLFLCTQNVDPLHERAGSARVWHMHGELMKSRCESSRKPERSEGAVANSQSSRKPERSEGAVANENGCGRAPFEDYRLYESADAIARCECGARVRPHIVWFGEVPFFMDEIARAIASCDVFVTIGSSGAVYPAAGFVRAARERPDVRTVYVGPELPDNARAFDECRLGKATEVVPSLFEVRR